MPLAQAHPMLAITELVRTGPSLGIPLVPSLIQHLNFQLGKLKPRAAASNPHPQDPRNNVYAQLCPSSAVQPPDPPCTLCRSGQRQHWCWGEAGGAGVCPCGGSVPCPSPSPHTCLTSSPVLPGQLASNQPH